MAVLCLAASTRTLRKALVEVGNPGLTEVVSGLDVLDADAVADQRATSFEYVCPAADRALSGRIKVRAVDIDAHRYALREVDAPAGVHARGRLGQQHTDAAVKHTKGLAGMVADGHLQYDAVVVDGDQ
jgi:hypothetical protein